MILIGILLGIALFVVLVFLCITLSDITTLDWVLIGFTALASALCGLGASKYKDKNSK